MILFLYTDDYDDKSSPQFYKNLYLDEEEKQDADLNEANGNEKEIDALGLRKPLKVNALMYKTAEMLGIDDLKTLASARFMRDAEAGFEMDGFEEPARLLYESTSTDDRDLRFKVTQLCVENYDVLEIRTKTLAILRQHGPNVWHVTVELLKRWTTDIFGTSKMSPTVRRRLENAVDNCNLKEFLFYCRQCVRSSSAQLHLKEDGSLDVKCDTCRSLGR